MCGKWKMIFQKKHMKIWYFLQVFWKDDLFKKTTLEHDLSCIIWKDGICFPGNTIVFLWTKSESWSSSRNTRGRVFSVYTCRRYKRSVRPLRQKNQRWPPSTKIRLKVIDTLGWHCRKGSNNSLYFYGDHYGGFHILLSSEKNQETWYIGLKFDFFLFNLFVWGYSTIKNLQCFVPFSPREL